MVVGVFEGQGGGVKPQSNKWMGPNETHIVDWLGVITITRPA